MSATRLDVRTNPDAKELIFRAAELRNETLTQFVVSTLSEAADSSMEIMKQEVTARSRRIVDTR